MEPACLLNNTILLSTFDSTIEHLSRQEYDLAVLVMHLDRWLFLVYSTKSLIAHEECRATSPNQWEGFSHRAGQ